MTVHEVALEAKYRVLTESASFETFAMRRLDTLPEHSPCGCCQRGCSGGEASSVGKAQSVSDFCLVHCLSA